MSGDRVHVTVCSGEVLPGDDPHLLGSTDGDVWDEDVSAILSLDHVEEDAGPTIFLHVPEASSGYWHAIQIPWAELYAAARRDGFELSWDHAAAEADA